eukprot:SAG31_NODE_24231_length_486_cov_0.919897_1_plen_110_part_00
MLLQGSGALAGHVFKLDRPRLAKALGFSACSMNSLDAVSVNIGDPTPNDGKKADRVCFRLQDRDFMLEFMGWSAMLGVHLSRWAEDLIIYGSKEFGYVKFADAYATVRA